MKNVKKLLALLMALVMLFAFCACSNSDDKDDKDDKKEGSSQSDKDNDKDDDKDNDKDDDKDGDKDDDKDEELTDSKLEGEWEGTLDIAALAAMMGEEMAIYDELGIKLKKCTLDFVFEDGEATIKMDGMIDWYVEMMEDVMDWCYEGDNMLEFVAAMEGDYTVDELKDLLAEDGMTVNDLLDQFFGEMDLEDMADELADELEDETTAYELDGNELIFEDEESVWTFSYSGGKIYILSMEMDGETYELNKGDFVLEK